MSRMKNLTIGLSEMMNKMLQNQIEEKRMLLEQRYNLSLQIEELFSKNETDEALILINRKDLIIKSLSRLHNVKDESFQNLQNKIKQQEEKNIELSKKVKEQIGKELKKLNKTAQLNNLYGVNAQKGSIVDILE